jgi:hypothetical protein
MLEKFKKFGKKLLQKRYWIPIVSVVAVGAGLLIYNVVTAASYPTLPTGQAYYESKFPAGLRYSSTWYGTMTHAPMNDTVWLYDDDSGICLVSFPVSSGAVPSGVQGGTTLTPVSITTAQALINSYPLVDYTAIDSGTLAKMTSTDYSVGVWGGDKLAQKFLTPQTNTETILSQAQLNNISSEQQSIEQTFDPNRYFVLATGNNNWSSTGTWSANSNGSPTGASVPTSADAVLPSSSIGTGATLTADAVVYFASMDWTGCANTPTLSDSAGSQWRIYGNVTFISGMNVSMTQSIYIWGVCTWKSAGKNIGASIGITNVGSLILGDAMSLTGGNELTLDDGSVGSHDFNTNGKSFTTDGTINISGTQTRTFNISGSTVTCATWTATTTTGLTFTTDASSKVVITGRTTFNGGSLTNYPEVDLNGSGTTTITGSNTFANLVLLSSVTQTIQFTDGTTQTVTNCSFSGSSGYVHTLKGTSTGGWTLTCTTGTITAGWMNITYSTATGGATFNAVASVDSLHNSGWNFDNNLYWVGNGGNTNDPTNHWSLTSGGSPNAGNTPVATVGVKFDANSFNTGSQSVNVNATFSCLTMDWTGVSNTPALSGSSAMNTTGNVTLVSGMTAPYTGTWTFGSIAGTQNFNSGGLTMACPITINDALGTVSLSTNSLNIGAATFTLTAGIFTTNSLNLTTTGLVTISGSTTRTFNMSSSTVTCGTWTNTTVTGETLTTTSSILTVTGAGTTFTGGGLTYSTVNLNGSGTTTIAGANTFTTLALPSGTTQTISFTSGVTQTVATATLSGSVGFIHTLQGTSGSAWTLSQSSGTCTVDYCSLIYSTVSGGATFTAQTHCVSDGHEVGWTFPTTYYWIGYTANWTTLTAWSYASGGTGGVNVVPATTTNVTFDVNSFSAGSQTCTVDGTANCLTMLWTGVTNVPTFAGSSALNIYGSLTFMNGVSMHPTYTGTMTFASTSAGNTITCGQTLACPITFAGIGGVWNLQDTMNLTAQTLTLTNGDLETNSQAVTTTGIITISGTATRTFNGTGSTVTCGTWTATTTTLLTFTAPANLTITGATTFNGGGLTYSTVNLNGSGTTTIAGVDTFANLITPSGTTQTIKFPNSVTTTVNACSLSGASGHVHTLTTDSGTSTWTINYTGAGVLFFNWLTISYSVATPSSTWYYGSNSTYNSTSGWTLLTVPTVTLSAATVVKATTATLNGNVTATGGVNPTVTMYYGSTDGGQTPANWTYSVAPTSPAQPQGIASFYYNATGLTSGSHVYYFSASASNAAGTTWVSGSLTFSTAGVITLIDGIATSSIIYIK